MEADTKPILSALTEGFKTTAESTYTLHVPFQRNSGEISELAQAYFPSHSVATSPALDISVKGKIRSVYNTAAKAERDLCALISNTLNELGSEEARDNFICALVKGSLTRNLLQRWRVRSETSEQIAAGTYLGTPIHDAKLGKLLCAEITSAYDTSKLAKPDQTTLNRLCNEWGLAQALIRKTIIINSWKGLKQDRQPPSIAFDAFAVALEPNTPAKDLIERFKLGTHQLIGSLAPTEWDRISLFLSEAELLREKALPTPLHKLQIRIEKTLASPEQDLPRHIGHKLLALGQIEWLEALKQSDENNLIEYGRALWPHKQSAPRYAHFEKGVFSAICVSIRQAHNFYSEYIKYPSIHRIHVIAPLNVARSILPPGEHVPDETIVSELRELAYLPIAPRLASFTFDAADRLDSGAGCILAFFELTRALYLNSSWRTPNKAQRIEMICHNPPSNFREYLVELIQQRRIMNCGPIGIYEDSDSGLLSCRVTIDPTQRRGVFR